MCVCVCIMPRGTETISQATRQQNVLTLQSELLAVARCHQHLHKHRPGTSEGNEFLVWAPV